MSGNEARNRNVFRRCWKVDRDGQRSRCPRQAVPDGGSGDWESPYVDRDTYDMIRDAVLTCSLKLT